MERGHLRRRALSALLFTSMLALACAAPRQAPEPVPPVVVEPARDTLLETPVVQQRAPVTRAIPYEGALGPADPPMRVPQPQKPLERWVRQALDVLYERPSPKGPPPIALDQPRAIYVVGGGPIVQALPGPAVFPDSIPMRVRTAMPDSVPFSNRTERLAGGTIRVVAFDRTLNDTKVTSDSMAIELSFTDADGAEWRIEQVTLAPMSPNPVAEPWFGGLAIDTLYHGTTGNGTPAVPTVTCAMCSWGWADVYKNGKRVASSAPLHVMVTSDTRGDDFSYACYDCTARPVREVHIVVAPSAHLPSPGGFLHVMWESADIRRGTPEQIRAAAPRLAQDVPTIELAAAPYLRWDKTEIRVRAGQKYRLIVHNEDPSSFHQFSLHAEPMSAGHHAGTGGDTLRHEEGMTAGGIGPLWKPGGMAHGESDPPGPRNVFFPLPQGSTWATFISFERPGEYEFMCPVGNHYRRGMEGKFIVTADGNGGAR